MSRILVTGACGFIGSHLARALAARGDDVVGLDNLSHGDLENTADLSSSPGYRFVRADVTDVAAVAAAAAGCVGVVHLAAGKIPRYGGAIETLHTNAFGMHAVLEAVRPTGAWVVLASTSDVVGMNPDLPFTEESASVLGPSTVRRWSYAVSKLFEEHLAFAYRDSHQTPVTILRFFGGYGPGHNLSWWGGPQSVFISAALRGETLEIHGDGEQRRTFLYIDDLVAGILSAVDRPAARGGVFNIGSIEDVSIRELAERIWSIVRPGTPLICRYIPYETFGKYQDVRRRCPDLRKSEAVLGFRPTISLAEGLKRTVDWQAKKLGIVPGIGPAVPRRSD